MTAIETGSIAEMLAAEGFGLDHLPYASFTPAGAGSPSLGVRIGNHVLTVSTITGLADASAELKQVSDSANLDRLLEAGRPVWDQLRTLIQETLADAAVAARLKDQLHHVNDVELHLPFTVGDYVDFYGNEYHATNVGKIFRPEQAPLTPNWKHLPIGYHGRSGSIVPSGTPVPRPKGMRPEPDGVPSFGPSRRLDIEAEVGFVLGGSAPAGEVALDQAGEHIFGLVLTNDWSARDIQAFEYVPLGPNLGKSFATSIAAWVTPVAALEQVRTTPPSRDIPLATYLDDSNTKPWGFDLQIEVLLNGETVSRPPFASTYWTAAQMLAHMTVNGASLRPGDFFAGGTISGPEKNQRGSFLELAWGGAEPLALDDGTEFIFLRDGDEVTLRATAHTGQGTFVRLGDCTGRIVPATTV
ncbi:fumarylacetoacetase [Arthrobacter sp. Marseille-P9274]|uniref:fumarylacetoacetase n=1 Tax=Arthrobacter sp. Marseille-P9274 TaxID=2866572 RepID=UPI0021C80663|nr:fumarylacetoacetase [Arthrobacter sp. Marseille-P9274]